MANENFRENLKIFIKSKNLTQKVLAENLGITQPQVNNLISGRDKFGLATAQAWGELLGIDPLWLMTQGEQGLAPGTRVEDTKLVEESKTGLPYFDMENIECGVPGGFGRKVQFADVTPAWLERFEAYMVQAGLGASSRSIHMRNLRTVFNYALENDLTQAPYPFRKFKIKAAKTEPMALTMEQLRLLWNHKPTDKYKAYWLDIWKLMFCLIGINMADLWLLDKVSQGRISYYRQKTGRLYSIKVEPEAKVLIEAHKGRNALVNLSDRIVSTKRATAAINRNMQAIAKDLGLPHITAYTARYTWASIAASIDIPIEVISQALGHSYGLAVTLGYIMPDRRKVDEANRKVLDLLK